MHDMTDISLGLLQIHGSGGGQEGRRIFLHLGGGEYLRKLVPQRHDTQLIGSQQRQDGFHGVSLGHGPLRLEINDHLRQVCRANNRAPGQFTEHI